MSEGDKASVSCWTCRRRRVKCDRLLPACQKCYKAAQPCQGYTEKPLRWVNSVASRGKLMGKTIPNIPQSQSIARVLIDPVFQDLSPAKRGYISYFDQHCSAESTLFQSMPTNPFKEFMRLIPASAGLLYTIISVAALHKAQRHGSLDLETPVRSTELTLTTSLPSPEFYDALVNKQQALYHLRKEFQDPNVSNHDGPIASILMFVWLELMDSGRDSWKYHLTALRRIVQATLVPTMDHTGGFTSTFWSSCQYFEMIFATYEILGSTFVKPSQPYQPLFTTMSIMDILKLCEHQTWVGCPAELLYLISLVNTVPESDEQSLSLKSHIAGQLQSFSPHRWSIADTKVPRMIERYHFACVYKEAIAIYVSQVTARWTEEPFSNLYTRDSLDSTIQHMSSISTDDPFFKALVWPAFVIGAEARNESQRKAVLEVTGHLWTAWRAGNVRNAVHVLKQIWARGDKEGWSTPWIEYLYEWGEDWMFV
ncbi:fungal-specific transcription factor domain-containing protein [Penicillium brevicompactum]|uniref:Fungal-specific transcription factor domain-containing protein n=1 Tax=Penicillium brevicompactum TaxID=5074 RepID=A0A9W9V4F4_PENBR|nr:fungal-specific transcription factor domain-containing protein [Penicillium brevicompactum]